MVESMNFTRRTGRLAALGTVAVLGAGCACHAAPTGPPRTKTCTASGMEPHFPKHLRDANFGGLADARCVDQVGYGSAVEVIDLGDGETYQRRARILFTRAGPGWSFHQYTRDGDGCRDLDLTDEQHDHLCPPD